MRALFYLFHILLLTFCSCKPLTSSPDEEQHQAELTLHEIQTNVDDLRHDLNRFETEISISDDKIRYQEKSLSALKEKEVQHLTKTLESLSKQIEEMQKTLHSLKKTERETKKIVEKLAQGTKKICQAFTQHKARLSEIEEVITEQNKKFREIDKMRALIVDISAKERNASYQLYTVKAGDTIEKLAEIHQMSAEEIMQINKLTKEIIIGQEIRLPKKP